MMASSWSRTQAVRRVERARCSPIASSRRFLPWDKDFANGATLSRAETAQDLVLPQVQVAEKGRRQIEEVEAKS